MENDVLQKLKIFFTHTHTHTVQDPQRCQHFITAETHMRRILIFNKINQSKKRVGCPCGKNGGQPSREDRLEIIIHRECAVEADRRNAGKKVSTQLPRPKIWKNRCQPIEKKKNNNNNNKINLFQHYVHKECTVYLKHKDRHYLCP